MTDIDLVLRIVSLFSGAYAVFSGFELHDLRDMFDEGGILSWKVVSLSQDGILSPLYEPFLEHYWRVMWARVILGIVLIGLVVVDAAVWSYAVVVTALFVTDICIRLRHTAGLSGAYDMSLVVNGGLAVAFVFAGYPIAQTAAVSFIAIQGVFSYSLAGISKFKGEEWRSGEALEVTFSTRVWGDERVFAFFERFPWLKRPATFGIMTGEVLFALVLFVDPPLVLAFFGIAFAFHVANAVFMGINGFLYIFPATYPAIYYVSEQIDISLLPV